MIGLRALAGNQNITADSSILTPLQGAHKIVNFQQIFFISAKISLSIVDPWIDIYHSGFDLWSLASNNVVGVTICNHPHHAALSLAITIK